MPATKGSIATETHRESAGSTMRMVEADMASAPPTTDRLNNMYPAITRTRLMLIIPIPNMVALPANCSTMRFNKGNAPIFPLIYIRTTAAEEAIPPHPAIRQIIAAKRISRDGRFSLGAELDAAEVFGEDELVSLISLGLPFLTFALRGQEY